MRTRAVIWAVFAAIFLATWWHPIYPAEQALHHSLTLIAVAALLWIQRSSTSHPRPALPTSSLVLVLIFLTLHTVAARWIYSFVPYDDWLHAVFGIRLSDELGWTRNDFDRLVHLAYGLCLAPVLLTYFADRRGWRPRWAALVAVDIIVSTGALYELFEWGIAVTLAPGYAEAYNGQQGDPFDAQKDMAIAALGAVVAVVITLLVRRRRSTVEVSEPAPAVR